jgi:hypothetical protein
MTDRDTLTYQVVFQRGGRCIGTIYWTGSLEETQVLAKRIALRLAADDLRMIEFNFDAPAWSDNPKDDSDR